MDRSQSCGSGSNVGIPKIMGNIRLTEPIDVDSSEDAAGEEAPQKVTHVMLHPDMYPGGTFAISRTGSEVGCWIRPGDVLLFDVVKKVIDGSCRAVPTKFVREATILEKGEATAADDTDTDESKPNANTAPTTPASTATTKPAIRLIEPSLLCGRTMGIIRSVHDNYGFIHLAERNVDTYFPLFEVFPPDMQMDLARNDANSQHNALLVAKGMEDFEKSIRNKGGRINIEVGMEVAFDVSLQTISGAPAGRDRDRGGGRYKQPPQEKESLRARRIQILPRGSVQETISVVSGVKAKVIKEDPKGQPFVGTLELEESLKMDANESQRHRHPLVAQLLDNIASGKYGKQEEEEGVVMEDVLADRDAQLVISMVNSREEEDLQWRYVTNDQHPEQRKLCISRKKKDSDKGENDDGSKPVTIASASSMESAEATGDEATSANEGEAAGTASIDETASTAASDSGPTEQKHHDHKKKSKKTKAVRTLRFDKYSFPDMSIGPIRTGDVISCDIVQNRRSGAMLVENIAVIERNKEAAVVSEAEEDGKVKKKGGPGKGFVTEVVLSRKFGFITAVDDHGAKIGEHLFFHFKDVAESEDVAHDGSATAPQSSLAGRSKKGRNDAAAAAIRKGDEVKFEISGPGKNGKLTATNISLLPRGTLKTIPTNNKEADKVCTGYILMEPSHTSLANTPSHVVMAPSGPASAGRSQLKEEGGRFRKCQGTKRCRRRYTSQKGIC
mmetsp:Transcript_43625/g.91745  ORF Transcript_43625/g.91745 Transcript_43625/m.91745 type:complete len:729 (-) Transcript_43625:1393-3579(-)